MNLLITGIHGFVGSNIVIQLKDKHTIYGLDIVSPEKEGIKKTLKWKDLDKISQIDTIQHSEILFDIDVIIHLAGKAHDTKNKLQAKEYFDINTGLTKKIFDFFLKSNVRKFIFFSSVKAAADFINEEMLTEEVIPRPKGPYGESKIAAEEYILSQKEKWDKSKQVYILRPCMIHGPGNKGNLNLLYQIVNTGLPWPLGDFENKRSFTSIDNLCFVISRLIQNSIPSGIYHMADDEPISTNDLITIMCETLGRRSHILKIRKGFIIGCAKLGSILHLPLNKERLQKLTENYVVSNMKIKEALHIEKMPVTAREGLIKTITSFSRGR